MVLKTSRCFKPHRSNQVGRFCNLKAALQPQPRDNVADPKRRESEAGAHQAVLAMNRMDLTHIPARERNPFAGWEQKAQGISLVLFFASAGLVWVRLWAPVGLFSGKSWPDGLLLVLAAGTTLTSLCRQLPAQNGVLAAVVIGAVGGGAESLGGAIGIPFGPFGYNPQNIGRPMFNLLPWTVPLIWVTAILNARGVACLVLGRYRSQTNYGFWLMGVTVLLVVLLELSFEPYAAVVKQYWSWKPTRIPSDWYTTPWTNFLGWTVTTALILLFVTPALINKSPIKHPPSYHTLIVWEVLSLLFLTATAHDRLWGAASLITTQMLLVAGLSMFGTRLKSSGQT
jgi:uncharacterized membrane protein